MDINGVLSHLVENTSWPDGELAQARAAVAAVFPPAANPDGSAMTPEDKAAAFDAAEKALTLEEKAAAYDAEHPPVVTPPADPQPVDPNAPATTGAIMGSAG